jgi:hypothetical protein
MRFAFILSALTFVAAPIPTRAQAQDQVAGVWRGDSLCASDGTACVNERVVYYITAIAGKAGVVTIRADKIVNGQAVTMGTAEWTHDTEHHTLIWETPRQTWLLKIDNDAIDGTLTLADKTVVRRMRLKKDR